MATKAKNIHLYLMDGDASGRIKCTLANWTGIAFKIPRTELERCRDRADLKQSGVYFLFGGTSDEIRKGVVYIGQAGARKNGEGILYRLQEHKRNPEKDYWTEAIAFTTSDNSLGATEISYLENRFCNMALEANRYEVKNGNDPCPGNITEEKESEMEEFIEYAKVVMGTLGHKLFIPVKPATKTPGEPVVETAQNGTILYLERTIKNIGKVTADGAQTAEGFVVLQGSHISLADDDTIPDAIKERRKSAPIDEDGMLKEDMLFTSPSYAAMFVIGKSANGLTSWKTADGKTLKALEAEQEAT
ncbi:MAG: GIY-YIG nuclease family protein [Oscillospiraceae bacterium]|nr:GIY-YIG nuclease family protein [Oscillospiraceae bacterium]